MARCRRPGPSAWPAGQQGRPVADGQAQTYLFNVPRHRRSRGGHQRRKNQAYRAQGSAETLPAAYRVSGRIDRSRRRQNARDAAYQNGGAGHRWNASEEQARQANVPEVKSLRRRQASAPGSKAGGTVVGLTEERYLSGSIVSTASRNRPEEDLGGPHLSAVGQGHHHRQWPDLRTLFRE